MRIAFDARPLIGPRTGVGVWLEGLLRGLAAGTDWSFVLCLPRRVAELGIGDLGGRASVLAPPVPLPGTLWLHTLAGPSLAGRADVFVGSLGVRPRRLSVPDVLMVHDVTPRTRPQAHTFVNRLCFNAYLEESLASAGAVVCLSEATRAAVARVQPGAARRARVIGAGVDPFFSPRGRGRGRGRDAPPLRRRPPVPGATRHARAPQGDRDAPGGARVAAGSSPRRPRPRACRRARLGRRVAGLGAGPPPRARPRPPSRVREPGGCPGLTASRRARRVGLRGGGVRPAARRGAGVRRRLRGLRRARPPGGVRRRRTTRRPRRRRGARGRARGRPRAGGATLAARRSAEARRGAHLDAAARRVASAARGCRPRAIRGGAA